MEHDAHASREHASSRDEIFPTVSELERAIRTTYIYLRLFGNVRVCGGMGEGGGACVLRRVNGTNGNS